MLGLENPIHLAFLLMILLLVFGAKRLPEMGKSLGSGLRGFKDSLGGEPTASLLATTGPHAVPADAAPNSVPAASTTSLADGTGTRS